MSLIVTTTIRTTKMANGHTKIDTCKISLSKCREFLLKFCLSKNRIEWMDGSIDGCGRVSKQQTRSRLASRISHTHTFCSKHHTTDREKENDRHYPRHHKHRGKIGLAVVRHLRACCTLLPPLPCVNVSSVIGRRSDRK